MHSLVFLKPITPSAPRYLRFALLFLLAQFFLVGCSTLNTLVNFQEPEVKVVSLTMLPSQGTEQRFGIGLKVLNPNNLALKIDGMSYRLKLGGYDLLSGATADVPEIGAFQEVPVNIEASASLLGALGFIKSIAEQPNKPVEYQFEARLDPGSLFSLPIKVVESGTIDLASRSN